jgi:dicarboxylate transporter 10
MQQDTYKMMLSSSFASIISSIITHPIDVVKVRIQNQVSNTNSSILPLIASISKKEGIGFLVNGVSASILRNGTFVTSKMFAYNYLKQTYNPQSFQSKFICGMSAGAFGSIIGTPFDVIMVHMQSSNKCNNIPQSIQSIYKHNGLLGFWKGFQYTISRAIIVTACQFSVYDQIKQELSNTYHEYISFTSASIISSITTGIVSNPVDVCKTRVINDIKPYHISSIIKQDGVLSLWKGVGTNICRQIPLNLVRFGCFEFFSSLLRNF